MEMNNLVLCASYVFIFTVGRTSLLLHVLDRVSPTIVFLPEYTSLQTCCFHPLPLIWLFTLTVPTIHFRDPYHYPFLIIMKSHPTVHLKCASTDPLKRLRSLMSRRPGNQNVPWPGHQLKHLLNNKKCGLT